MKFEKKRESCDVVIVSFAITVVRWNNDKILNVISTFTDKEPTQKVEQCCQKQNNSVKIEQPEIRY